MHFIYKKPFLSSLPKSVRQTKFIDHIHKHVTKVMRKRLAVWKELHSTGQPMRSDEDVDRVR
jgi:hypothetical protein